MSDPGTTTPPTYNQIEVKVQPPVQQKAAVPGTLSTPSPNEGRVAVIVCHGMGQQVPFETLDSVAKTLSREEQRHNKEQMPQTNVRLVRFGGKTLPRAELTLTDSDGGECPVDLYEAYWAPITEGKVTALETFRFLVSAWWNGMLYSRRGMFSRFMFGKEQVLEIKRARTMAQLMVALLVVCSLVLLYSTFLATSVASLLIGFNLFSGNVELIDLLTMEWVIYILLVVIALVVGNLVGSGTRVVQQLTVERLRPGESQKTGAVVTLWVILVCVMAITVFAGALTTYHWIHLWNNSGLTRLDRALVWAANTLLIKPVYIFFLVVGATVFYYMRWYFVQYAGDVAAYVSPYTVSKFQGIRDEIQNVGLSVAKSVYGAQEEGQGVFKYNQLFIVGHSLGSVVAYDTLNAMINEDILGDSKLKVLDRTKMLLTFGSPLDKTAFIFRTQATDAIVREGLAAAVQPLIQKYDYRPSHWINIWSRNDWISGPLEYYDKPKGESEPLELEKRVLNIIDEEASKPLLAHGQYWENNVLGDVLYTAVTGRDLEQLRETLVRKSSSQSAIGNRQSAVGSRQERKQSAESSRQ